MPFVRTLPFYINKRFIVSQKKSVVTVQTCDSWDEALESLEKWFEHDDQAHYYIARRVAAKDLSSSIPPWKERNLHQRTAVM